MTPPDDGGALGLPAQQLSVTRGVPYPHRGFEKAAIQNERVLLLRAGSKGARRAEIGSFRPQLATGILALDRLELRKQQGGADPAMAIGVSRIGIERRRERQASVFKGRGTAASVTFSGASE